METVLLISQAQKKISEIDKLRISLPQKLDQKLSDIYCITDEMDSKKQSVKGVNGLKYTFIPNEPNSINWLIQKLEQYMTLTIAHNINEPIAQILKTLKSYRILAGMDDKHHTLYIKDTQRFLKETMNLNEIDTSNLFTKTVDKYVNTKGNVTTSIKVLTEKKSTKDIATLLNEVSDVLSISGKSNPGIQSSTRRSTSTKSRSKEVKKNFPSVNRIEFIQGVNDREVTLNGMPIGKVDLTLKFVVILQDLYENYNSIEKCISADELDERAYQKLKKLKPFQEKKVETESEKGIIGTQVSELKNEGAALHRLRNNKYEFFKLLEPLKFLGNHIKVTENECCFDSMGRVEITFR